jgi:ribosomal protein L37AE/L43A
MEGSAAGQASVPGAGFLGRQLCPQCAYTLVAPDVSQHIWFCEACGTEFATLVKLRRQGSGRSAAAA